MRYRLFTNDVGPMAFSCLKLIDATCLEMAKSHARRIARDLGCKVLVLPDDDSSRLMPNGRTGEIPVQARSFIVGD